MPPEDKALVKTTWAMVVPIADVAATLFYERLFALDSSLRPMFDRTDMKEQRRKLLAALGTVVNGLDNLEPLIPVLENLGRNHSRYGVKDAHYETVGAALLCDARARSRRSLDARCESRVDTVLWNRSECDAQRG